MTLEQINTKINEEFDTIIREENNEYKKIILLKTILKRKSDNKIFQLRAKKHCTPAFEVYIYNNINSRFESIYCSIAASDIENAYEKMLSIIEHF